MLNSFFNFIKGAGSILEIWLKPEKTENFPVQSDEEALKSDWAVLGKKKNEKIKET